MRDQKLHINKLAAECRVTGSNEAYKALYDALLPGWKRRWAKDVQSTLGDYGEIESLYNLTLYQTVTAWDPDKGNFEHMFNYSIKRRKINLFRESSRRANRRARQRIDDDNPDAPTFDIVDEATQAEAPENRKRDQRQLISSLAASADDKTRVIVQKFLEGDYDSVNALAKALGIHHEVVGRKLRALSKHFRQELFGDYREYLAV